MTTAAFKARNLTTSGAWSLFADAGFDAAPGDEIEVQLEGSPALDIRLTAFSCVGRSDGRSVPVFDPVDGIAATPTSAVSFTMPAAEYGTWAIQCQTNDGESVEVNGEVDFTINTKVRYFAARTATLDLRHPLASETTEYTPNGWAVALQELEDAVDAFAAGAGTYTAGAGLTESPAGTFNVGANGDGSITVNANDIKVGVLASDTQHGVRGGGTQHAVVIAGGAAGFMSGTDKTKLDGLGAGATVVSVTATAPLASSGGANPDISLSYAGAASPANIATSASGGSSVVPAKSDHVHALTFAPVQSVLAGATSGLTFNGQNLSSIGDLTVGGNLTVQGTTTTVNSTVVAIADRLIVVNSSALGVVAVPSAIAGFIVDRGSADGVTKRDAAGLFWDEGNARFTAAYNTTADQSTIGSLVAFLSGAHIARADGIGTTKTNGLTAENGTAATAGVTRQYSPTVARKGSSWVSSANRAMYVIDELEPRTNGALDWVFYYDAGSGIAEAFRFTTATSGQFVTALQSHSIAFGFSLFHDGTNSGFFINGADSALHLKNRVGKGVWYSDEDLEIQTGGANARMHFDATGDKIAVSSLELNVKQLASTPFAITFASSIEIDWDKGAVQTLTLTGNVTSLTCKNIRAGALCVLLVRQDATGGRSIGFDSNDFEDYLRLASELGTAADKRTAYTFIGRTDATHVIPLSVRADILIP